MKNPDSTAVVGMGHRAVSYKELNRKSNQMAQFLREKGAGPGTIVAVMLERSIESIVA